MTDEAGKFVALTTDAERRHLMTFAQVEDALIAALAAGQSTVTLELPVMAWLAILDEVRDRRPRNYTRILADHTADVFASMAEALCDQMHDELTRFAVQLDSMEAAINHTGRR